MDNHKKKLSIKDIAAISGVSIATVSRVLNNKGGYSKETEEKINVIKDILDSYAVKIIQGDMINNPMKPTSGGNRFGNDGPTPNQFMKSQFEKMVRE